MSATVTFEEVEHRYSVNGLVMPSVTQVLCGVNLIDTRWFDELSAWRGSVVHRICELDDQNDLDESDVDERVQGYLDAWRAFKANLNFIPELIEHRVYHPTLGYAGTLDRTGTINDGTKVIIDIKSGSPAPATGLQLIGYALCLDEPRAYQRYAVQLSNNGKYHMKMFPQTDFHSDRLTWESAVRVYRWQEEKKLCRP